MSDSPFSASHLGSTLAGAAAGMVAAGTVEGLAAKTVLSLGVGAVATTAAHEILEETGAGELIDDAMDATGLPDLAEDVLDGTLDFFGL